MKNPKPWKSGTMKALPLVPVIATLFFLFYFRDMSEVGFSWGIGISMYCGIVLAIFVDNLKRTKQIQGDWRFIPKRFLIPYGIFVLCSILALVTTIPDIKSYSITKDKLDHYEKRFLDGETSAALHLVEFYREGVISINTRNNYPSSFRSFNKLKNGYRKWLEKYVRQIEVVKSKDKEALRSIKELAKINIGGIRLMSYTSLQKTQEGIRLYRLASSLGDGNAINEMNYYLKRADGIRISTQKATERRKRYLRQKKLAESKKSFPEEVGKVTGTVSKAIGDFFAPIGEFRDKFKKGYEKGKR